VSGSVLSRDLGVQLVDNSVNDILLMGAWKFSHCVNVDRASG